MGQDRSRGLFRLAGASGRAISLRKKARTPNVSNSEDLPSIGKGPAIVLVEPQLGENIGMVARAMANFGLSDLRLVNPRDGWPNEKARAAASRADHARAPPPGKAPASSSGASAGASTTRRSGLPTRSSPSRSTRPSPR
jgi:hypothetical protein